MKKTLIIVLTAAMLLALCACGDTAGAPAAEKPAEEAAEELQEEAAAAENMAGLPNPMTEYSSIAEINEITGGKLCHPAVMGVTDEKFFIISAGDITIAQYMFSLNGVPYTFRFSPCVSEDISGIYVGDGTAFGGGFAGEEMEFCVNTEVMAARWFTIDGQYMFCSDDVSVTDETVFRAGAEELQMLTKPGMSDSELAAYYESLAGEYYDTWSQRAMATVTANGDSIGITVSWSSSAAEHTEWTMTAKRGEDGLLYYTDCTACVVTYGDGSITASPDITTEPYEFPAEGYFGESEGMLYWNGAGDEYCANCVFAKVSYTPAQ